VHVTVLMPLSGNSPTTARYIRITATRLWQRSNDYVFALSEMQVESQGKNIAVVTKVTALDSIEAGRWSKKHLVDGFSSRRKLPNVIHSSGNAAEDEVRR